MPDPTRPGDARFIGFVAHLILRHDQQPAPRQRNLTVAAPGQDAALPEFGPALVRTASAPA